MNYVFQPALAPSSAPSLPCSCSSGGCSCASCTMSGLGAVGPLGYTWAFIGVGAVIAGVVAYQITRKPKRRRTKRRVEIYEGGGRSRYAEV